MGILSTDQKTNAPVGSINEAPMFSILHTEWAQSWGGQVQRVMLESVKMKALGHSVVIACQPGSPLLHHAREKGITAEEVRIRGQIDVRAIRDIYRLIKKYHITVVNTHSSRDNWAGGLAAKLAGVPLLVRTRHHPVRISNHPLNFIHKLADGFIATGEAVRSGLINDNKIPPDRVVSIPTGVSLERFLPEIDSLSLKRELGIAPFIKVVTIVAGLGKNKRHDLFLDAACLIRKKLPDVKFLIVGDGAERESIKKRITEYDLSEVVIMTGYRADIPEIMASSDVVVLTSDSEGVPQVLSQAMAMERPVVAAPIGAIPDLIEDGVTGLFAAAGDASSFADKILTLLRDEGFRRNLGSAGRQHVLKHFTDEIMAEKTIAFYRYLLNLKHGSTAA